MFKAELIPPTINFLISIDEDIAQLNKRIDAEEEGPQESISERMRNQAYVCREILYKQLESFYLANISTEQLIKDIQRQ